MLAVKNLTRISIDKKVLHRVAKIVFKGENISKEREVSVVFVKTEEIEKLNLKYRKKNKPTDVLSFEGEKDNLGEIIICPEEVKKNAEINFKKEIIFVFIHGILHLLGYDHEKSKKDAKIMEEKTQQYIGLWQKVK